MSATRWRLASLCFLFGVERGCSAAASTRVRSSWCRGTARVTRAFASSLCVM
jgi:hypothetical protein